MNQQPPGPIHDPQGQYVPYAQYAQPNAPQQRTPQPPRAGRMPRNRALAVTKTLKAALIAGSVMAFGVLTALAAGHVTGVTAAAGTNSAPSHESHSNDNGGFFNQEPSDDGGNAGSFGVSPNAPAQQPVAGSSVS